MLDNQNDQKISIYRKHIGIDIFRKTFQKLTFTYCIPISTLCDSSHCYNTYNTSIDLPKDSDYYNIVKAFRRLLPRLCIAIDLDKLQIEPLLSEPKIYDELMFESQMHLYNISAEKIGYEPITKIRSISVIENLFSIDDSSVNYDELVKHFPYFPDKIRNGVNFLEFILILNMNLMIHHRSLNTLTKETVTEKDKSRVKEMVRKVTENLRSEPMFLLYAHAVFDILEEVANTIHNEKAEKSIRLAWLPERLKNRKDAFRAFESYRKKFHDNYPGRYDEADANYKMIIQGAGENFFAYESLLDSNNLDAITSELLPMIFYILVGRGNELYDLGFSAGLILYANHYAEAIREYIIQSVAEVEKFLNKLYIEKL